MSFNKGPVQSAAKGVANLAKDVASEAASQATKIAEGVLAQATPLAQKAEPPTDLGQQKSKQEISQQRNEINDLVKSASKYQMEIIDELGCNELTCAAPIGSTEDWKRWIRENHPDKVKPANPDIPGDDQRYAKEKERATNYWNVAYGDKLGECKTKKEFCK